MVRIQMFGLYVFSFHPHTTDIMVMSTMIEPWLGPILAQNIKRIMESIPSIVNVYTHAKDKEEAKNYALWRGGYTGFTIRAP